MENQTITSYIQIIQIAIWVVALARYLWRQSQKSRLPMIKIFLTDKLLLIIILLGFLISGYSLYLNYQKPIVCITTFPNLNKVDFIEIKDKNFMNETVFLDGYRFDSCHFLNVTFVWNGIKPYMFYNCSIGGTFRIASKNDAISSTMHLLKDFNFLKDNVNVTTEPGHPEMVIPSK